MKRTLVILLGALLCLANLCAGKAGAQVQNEQSYKNNVYLLISTSKFYFNYRHSVNVLTIYEYLKQTGITDDQIILMLPTDHACMPSNIFPGKIHASS